MCVDYTNLNKACSKDCHPLPVIEQKVDALVGFKIKCFLDAYKGYHQIMMEEGDAKKTAFITERWIFCYKKMVFELKNVEATYQRLMDCIFKQWISRNVKMYVDDMSLKSRTFKDFLNSLKENFEILREVNMKFNPKKCTFGVGEGKFL